MSSENIKEKYSALLSEEECLIVVRKACGDVQLISREIVQASSDIVGYLGDYYKLNVIYSNKNYEGDQEHKITFFIKSLPLNNEIHKDEIVSKGFMEKERISYSTLFPDMEEYCPYKWRANAYLVRKDLIVFEDLVRSGYKIEKLQFDFPPKYVHAVLECLAGMHANSFIFEEKTGKDINKDYKNVTVDNRLTGNTWVLTGLQAICKVASIHPNFKSAEYQTFIKNGLRKRLDIIYDTVKPSPVDRNALAHRDLWEKNILFKSSTDGLKCVFVDFQIASYSPPALDVLFFLYLNATKSNRDNNMKAYLDHYYKSLEKFTSDQGVDVKTLLRREEFDKTCQKYAQIALILTGVYAPISYLPDGYLGSINQKDAKKFAEIMNVDRDDFTVECIDKFKDYGVRVLGVIQEIVDSLYTNQIN